MKSLAAAVLACTSICSGQQYNIMDTLPRAAVQDTLRQRRIVVSPGVDIVVPQLVDGASWKTSLFLTNLDSKPVHYVVFFSDDRGESLSVPIVGIGSVIGVVGSLPVSGSTSIESEGSASTLAQGYAVVATLDKPFGESGALFTEDRLAGMAVFRQRVAGRPDFEAVVPLSPVTETQMVLPFDNRAGFSTGVAVVNPDPNAASSVQFTFRSEDGAVIKQETVRIESLSKVTFSIPDRFPEAAGRGGRLELRTFGNFLSALGLRFNPSGAFTSFHALSIDSAVAPPVAPPPPTGSLPGITQACQSLMNTQIYADDGTFLGRISTNQYQSDSIANEYGRYGGQYSSTSIFNAVGTYGSTVSPQSPFNSVATRPPIIYSGGQGVAYLTINTTKTPRVDPMLILSCVGRTR